MNVTHALVCGLSGSRAVCPVLMRSASCMYPLMSVLPKFRTVNYRTIKRVSWTGTPCSFCDLSMKVLSVSYTVHIPFVHYTSVIRMLVGHSLSVTCLVRMHSLRLPRRHSPPLRRLLSLDKHFLHSFCPLPLSVDMWCTITFFRWYVTAP